MLGHLSTFYGLIWSLLDACTSHSVRTWFSKMLFQQNPVQGKQTLPTGGCLKNHHTGEMHTAICEHTCECCSAMQVEDAHGTGWSAGGQSHCHDLVCTVVP